MISPSAWKPDSTSSQCMDCQRPFSLLRRRHHCRHCGNLFCAECTVWRLWLRPLEDAAGLDPSRAVHKPHHSTTDPPPVTECALNTVCTAPDPVAARTAAAASCTSHADPSTTQRSSTTMVLTSSGTSATDDGVDPALPPPHAQATPDTIHSPAPRDHVHDTSSPDTPTQIALVESWNGSVNSLTGAHASTPSRSSFSTLASCESGPGWNARGTSQSAPCAPSSQRTDYALWWARNPIAQQGKDGTWWFLARLCRVCHAELTQPWRGESCGTGVSQPHARRRPDVDDAMEDAVEEDEEAASSLTSMFASAWDVLRRHVTSQHVDGDPSVAPSSTSAAPTTPGTRRRSSDKNGVDGLVAHSARDAVQLSALARRERRVCVVLLDERGSGGVHVATSSTRRTSSVTTHTGPDRSGRRSSSSKNGSSREAVSTAPMAAQVDLSTPLRSFAAVSEGMSTPTTMTRRPSSSLQSSRVSNSSFILEVSVGDGAENRAHPSADLLAPALPPHTDRYRSRFHTLHALLDELQGGGVVLAAEPGVGVEESHTHAVATPFVRRTHPRSRTSGSTSVSADGVTGVGPQRRPLQRRTVLELPVRLGFSAAVPSSTTVSPRTRLRVPLLSPPVSPMGVRRAAPPSLVTPEPTRTTLEVVRVAARVELLGMVSRAHDSVEPTRPTPANSPQLPLFTPETGATAGMCGSHLSPMLQQLTGMSVRTHAYLFVILRGVEPWGVEAEVGANADGRRASAAVHASTTRGMCAVDGYTRPTRLPFTGAELRLVFQHIQSCGGSVPPIAVLDVGPRPEPCTTAGGVTDRTRPSMEFSAAHVRCHEPWFAMESGVRRHSAVPGMSFTRVHEGGTALAMNSVGQTARCLGLQYVRHYYTDCTNTAACDTDSLLTLLGDEECAGGRPASCSCFQSALRGVVATLVRRDLRALQQCGE